MAAIVSISEEGHGLSLYFSSDDVKSGDRDRKIAAFRLLPAFAIAGGMKPIF